MSTSPSGSSESGRVDDLVPAAGKHAARPSQAEHQQELHDYPQTNSEALRQEGLEPREEHYHLIEDAPRPTRGEAPPGR
jgi:hypothetical protein